MVLVWSISFPWFTVELLLLLTVDKEPSQTLTPSATELFEALTRLTPLAPSIAVPDRSTDPLVDVVIWELLVAIAPPAGCVTVAPAVTLSICVSLMACALLCFAVDWSLFCPNAGPRVSVEAARRMQIVLVTVYPPMSSDFWSNAVARTHLHR